MFDSAAPPPVRKAGKPAIMLLAGAGTVDVGCGVKAPPEPGTIPCDTACEISGLIIVDIDDICLSYQNVSVSFICRVVGKMRNNCAALRLRLNINV
jgi:hypothetical protein